MFFIINPLPTHWARVIQADFWIPSTYIIVHGKKRTRIIHGDTRKITDI